jgi:phosphoglycerol transferase
MVWQIPYQPFPESGAIVQMENYGPLRGYLNSTALRWSFGAMKGRDADRWMRAVAERPLGEQLQFAARSGFGAVYIDRRGFDDRGVAAEKVLQGKLGAPLAQSQDGMLAIYRMQPEGLRPLPLVDVLVPIDTPIRFDAPVLGGLVARVSGVSGWEPWGRWSEGSSVRIALSRPLPPRFVLRIETAMALPPSVGVELPVRIAGVQHQFKEVIARELTGQVDLLIDSGGCGLEPTTVVDVTGDFPVIVRRGLGSSTAFE